MSENFGIEDFGGRDPYDPTPYGFRLLQVFLHVTADGEPQVHEVSINDDERALYCTCQIKTCVHKTVVAGRINDKTQYTWAWRKDAPGITAADVEDGMTIAKMRAYILKWNQIMVTEDEKV